MLNQLSTSLQRAQTLDEKICCLESLSSLKTFFSAHPHLKSLFEEGSKFSFLFKQLIALNQAEALFLGVDPIRDHEKIQELFSHLEKIDDFYREMGGLIGYQLKVKELIEQKGKPPIASDLQFHPPSFIDIASESKELTEFIDAGIDAIEEMAEIYVLGGAADRLHLVDPKTKEPLPAAKLKFAGMTLIEKLICDLQAREHLYYQKKGVQFITPIAIMTSHEKENHKHVVELFEQHNYFGRPKESIRFFTQPLVPTVDENGDWCLSGPLKPILKPGGHGVIWKLAKDRNILSWFFSLNRKKALVRQINNPIAGIDSGLLAFSGIGFQKDMLFGFASCPRLVGSAEGVNVLIERKDHLVLTNIEYCDFAKYQIEDAPLKKGEPYSRFSSNTNILFVDLKAIEAVIDKSPFPGLLVNLKKGSFALDSQKRLEKTMGRLESTMQNIADVFVEKKGESLTTKKTFVTYNVRHKTISTAKRGFVAGGNIKETPEQCFYDLMCANRELLELCQFTLPSKRSLEEYLQKGPEVLFVYHPTLGPLYKKIMQKLKKGSLHEGSELLIQGSDVDISELQLNGSLQILMEQPVGHFDENGHLQFSSNKGSCVLENVTIENRGVDWESSSPFWKMEQKRRETVQIILKGKSKFIARNLHLRGNHKYIVEDGEVLEIL